LTLLFHNHHLLVRRGGNERDSPRFAAFGACLLHVLDRHLIDFRLPLNNPPIQKSRGSQFSIKAIILEEIQGICKGNCKTRRRFHGHRFQSSEQL